MNHRERSARTSPSSRRLALVAVAGLLVTTAASVAPAAAQGRDRTALRADTALVPELDGVRAGDAEIRIALYEMVTGRPAAALARLRAAAGVGGDSAGTTAGTGPSDRRLDEEDRRFLMAECFFRLAMADSLAATARRVLAGPAGARYGSVLRAQLLVTAYRAGDIETAAAIAAGLPDSDRSAVTALIGGLVAYRRGDSAGARAGFAGAQRAPGAGPIADYARYMTAVSSTSATRGAGGIADDSSRAAAALPTLDAGLPSTGGEAGNQLRVATAELAADAGQSDRAIALVDAVDPASGSDVQARLIRAWVLARSAHPDRAAKAFGDLADRYPQLPEQEESRLLAAQAMLDAQHAADAQGAFRAVGDLAGAEETSFGQWSADPHSAARALVEARAADLLLLPDVTLGKTLAMSDSEAADRAALRAVGGPRAGAGDAAHTPPAVLSVAAVGARIDSAVHAAQRRDGDVMTPSDEALLRRAIFAGDPPDAAATEARAQLARSVRALHDADVAVAVADASARAYRDNVGLQLLVLEHTRQAIGVAGDSLAPTLGRVAAIEDSLARVTETVDAAGGRLHRMFEPQVTGTRSLASENLRQIDSVRLAVAAVGTADDREALRREAEIAATYAHLADAVDRGLVRAIGNHPAFALRDTIRLRGERTRQLIVQTRRAVAAGEAAVDDQVARVSADDTTREVLRRTLVAASAAQDQAAAALTAAVARALGRRAEMLAAAFRRDQEAAAFGAASAGFFRATAASATPGDEPLAADSALADLERVVARYPASAARASALFELGELLVRRADERFAAAQRRAIGEAVRGVPDQQGHPDYGPAIARFEELIRRYPAFPQLDGAAYTLGTLYAADGRYADAASMFERVSAADGSPLQVESWFRLGDARFELASGAREDVRRGLFGSAAAAYERAAAGAAVTSDLYYLALYKLGWSYYSQGSQQNLDAYRKAVDVFGRLIEAYDRLPPERQARLGLRDETLDYMAVSLTQVGGPDALDQYFVGRSDTSYKSQVLRRVAVRLRDQGDFTRAVQAYQELLVAVPTDSGALAVSRDVVDIYQNRTLEPDKAQAARLALVERFTPGFSWTVANQPLARPAEAAREDALRQSAQYELARAEALSPTTATGAGHGRSRAAHPPPPAPSGPGSSLARVHYAEAARLYARYMADYGTSDSARAVETYYAEALFGTGDYGRAGAEYERAAYGFPGDSARGAAAAEQRAAQNAIVAYDSALAAHAGDRTLQDSLFSAITQYAARYPGSDVAKRALIEEGRRASEAGRWAVMAAAFRQYAAEYPRDPYAPTAAKLVGDALYRDGKYADAQAQWDSASLVAQRAGRRALADSVQRIQTSAASSYADSLVRAGEYARAASDVYVAYADAHPTTEKAADALRDAVETYLLADSAARARGDDDGSRVARTHAADLAQRLVTQYPLYRYRRQYQTLYSDLLAQIGRGDESVDALRRLIAGDPTWSGRADAEIRLAVRLDSLGKKTDAAAAYQRFAADYPHDRRAPDAEYDAAETFLEARDTAAAARAYGAFARHHATDPRAGQARAQRVGLLTASGDTIAAAADLAVLCTASPPAELRADCATRAGRAAFAAGLEAFRTYRPLRLVIATPAQLTAAGVKRAAARKQELLAIVTRDFTRAIESGDPGYLAAGTYYIGLAQWEYGTFLASVQLPASLSDAERAAARQGAARQADVYYQQAKATWQALVDKAGQQGIANQWVDRARDGVRGTVADDP